MNKSYLDLRLLGFTALLVLFSLAPSLPVHAAGAPEAIVSSARLNVRQGPGTSYAVLDVAQAGAALPIIGQSGDDWLEVSLADGGTGWVSSAYVVVSGRREPDHQRRHARLPAQQRRRHLRGQPRRQQPGSTWGGTTGALPHHRHGPRALA
jgi:hypothetical protein